MKIIYPDGRERLRRARYRYNEKVPNENGMFMPGTFCIRTSIMRDIGGFDERIKFGEFTDIDFILQGKSVSRSFTNKCGIYYQQSVDGGSKNQQNKIEALTHFLKKHQQYFKRNKSVKRLFLQNLANLHIRVLDFKVARKYYAKAYITLPWKFITLLRYFASCIPFVAKKIWKV